jgi:hypothetical protein
MFLTADINAYSSIIFYDMYQPITDAQKEAYSDSWSVESVWYFYIIRWFHIRIGLNLKK